MDLDMRAILTEGLGTFTLVFLGCGTAALMAPDNQSAMLIVAMAFALALIFIIFAWGSISANVNPAISAALALDGQITIPTMVAYWIAQFLGAILAALLLLFILGSESSLGASVGSLTYNDPWKAVLVEALLTFFLVTIVLITGGKNYTGLIIGLTLGVGVLLGYQLTGGSLNPARSLGPALVSGETQNLYIYFVGPFIGALLAYIVYVLLYPKKKED